MASVSQLFRSDRRESASFFEVESSPFDWKLGEFVFEGELAFVRCAV